MRWFGRAYGAAYEDDSAPVPVPVGMHCKRCDEAFTADSDGFLMTYWDADKGAHDIGMHYECHMRQIIGGLNHLLGICTCCGGDAPPDPPALSKRQAAQAAVQYWNAMRLMALRKNQD